MPATRVASSVSPIKTAASSAAITGSTAASIAAVLVPVADAEKLYGGDKKSFAEHLLAFPGGIEFERDRTPLRDIEV